MNTSKGRANEVERMPNTMFFHSGHLQHER